MDMMNNRRIGKFAVTAIVGVISAISGIASMEMIKSLKKEGNPDSHSEKTAKDNKDTIIK